MLLLDYLICTKYAGAKKKKRKNNGIVYVLFRNCSTE